MIPGEILPGPHSIPPWNKSSSSRHMSSAGQAEQPCFEASCCQPDHSQEMAVAHGPDVRTMGVEEEAGERGSCDSIEEYPSSRPKYSVIVGSWGHQ